MYSFKVKAMIRHKYYLGPGISKNLSNMHAQRSPQCSRYAELQHSKVVNNNPYWRKDHAYLTRDIKKRERRRPHTRHELGRGGNDEGCGGLNGRVHARCLGLGTERRIWRRVSKGVGSYDLFNLLNRRLYDVAEGFQFGKGVLRHPSKNTVKRLTLIVHA